MPMMLLDSGRFVTSVMQTSNECIINEHPSIFEASLMGELYLMLPMSLYSSML